MKIELENYLDKLKKIRPRRILLQFPEGFKIYASKIAAEVKESIKVDVIISGEPCYGACDLRLEEAKLLDCDLILHLGHSNFGVKSKIKVLYVPAKVKIKFSKKLKSEIKKIKENKLSIYSSEPFKEVLDELEIYLKKINKIIVDKEILLGCSKTKELGEANIFIGSGKFHTFALSKKTYFIDLEKNEVKDITNLLKKEEMKKQARINGFREAKRIAILISKKPGQFYKDYKKLKEKLEKEGKNVEILIFDEITDLKLLGYDFDFYLNTACPRILDSIKGKLINLRDLNYG